MGAHGSIKSKLLAPASIVKPPQNATTFAGLISAPVAQVMGALNVDELTEVIIGAAITVHTALGPGLLESIYRDALFIELTARGLTVKVEEHVPVFYRGQRIRGDLKIDLLVDGRVILEIKAVDRLHPVFQAQVITYLKLTGHPAGLLLNFNATTVRAGLKRLDHPDLYATKHGRIAASEDGEP